MLETVTAQLSRLTAFLVLADSLLMLGMVIAVLPLLAAGLDHLHQTDNRHRDRQPHSESGPEVDTRRDLGLNDIHTGLPARHKAVVLQSRRRDHEDQNADKRSHDPPEWGQ